MLTEIPRSSVGYYVRKFNKKYGRDGLQRKLNLVSLSIDKSSRVNKDKVVASAVLKMISVKSFFDMIGPLIRERRFRDLHYLLKCMKLTGEMSQPLMLRPEERKILDKVIKQFIQLLTESVNLKMIRNH